MPAPNSTLAPATPSEGCSAAEIWPTVPSGAPGSRRPMVAATVTTMAIMTIWVSTAPASVPSRSRRIPAPDRPLPMTAPCW